MRVDKAWEDGLARAIEDLKAWILVVVDVPDFDDAALLVDSNRLIF